MKIDSTALRKAMKQKGISCGELADMAGVYISNVSRWRNGRQSISRGHMIAVANTLGVRPEDLTEDPGKTKRWIPVEPDGRGYTNQFECSACGGTILNGYYDKTCFYNYCPCCGARMEE